MSEIKFRPYMEGDENGIVELLNIVFGRWPSLEIDCGPVDFWRWKYLDNPVKISDVHLAIDDGRIIGCHHIQYLKLHQDGNLVLSSMSTDLAIHPDYRGRGLATKISVPNETRAEDNGLELSHFITSNPILIKSFTSSSSLEKRRPRFPSVIKNYTRIRDIGLQLEKMPMDNPFILKTGWTILSTINQMLHSTPNVSDSGRIEEVDCFGEDYSVFWNRVGSGYRYIVDRSAAYLNWKFCDPRVPGYRKILYRDPSGVVQGFMVFSINRFNPDYPVGYIVDLIVSEGMENVVSSLVSHALDVFDAEDVNIVNFQQVDKHPHLKILESFGFLDGRINIHLFYNTYSGNEGLDYLKHVPSSETHVTWGDHDVLPVVIPKTT